MKRILTIILTMLLSTTTLFAEVTKNLHLKFSQNQFSFTYDARNVLTISPICDDNGSVENQWG